MLKNNKKIGALNRYTILLVLTGSIAALIFLYLSNRAPQNNTPTSSATTTSSELTAQDNFSEGNERQPSSTSQDKGNAVISDAQGLINQIPEQSQWITSSTGEITLYTPFKKQNIGTGDWISGESTLPAVNYRIIDDLSGVISSGTLSVVDGKFAGTINVKTSAASGRIDVYGQKADLTEFSNIEIEVSFRE